MNSSDALLKVFRSVKISYAILTPNSPVFIITEASNPYVKNIGKPEVNIIGKNVSQVLEVEIKNNGIPGGSYITQSLNKVIATKSPDKIAACKILSGPQQKYWDVDHIPLLNEFSEIECIVQTISDVTEEVLSQKSTQSSSIKKQESLTVDGFKSLVENSIGMIGVIDEKGNYQYISPTFFTNLGIHPEELLGKNAENFIHPDDKELVLSDYKKLQTSKQIKISPFRFKHKNGTWRWLETIVCDLRDDPAVKGIVTNSTDITERVRTGQQLNNSEEKYKLLFQLGPVPKWVFNLSSLEILDVNESAMREYGYSRKEFLGMTMSDLLPPGDNPEMKRFAEIKKENHGVIDFGTFTHQKKDGTRIKVEVSGHQLKYNEKDCLIISGIDITGRQKALEQSREAEAKLLTAQKIARLGYWKLTVPGNLLYWSDEVYNIWGVNKKSFKVNFNSFFEIVHPDDREFVFHAQSNSIATGAELDLIHRILLPDDSVRWVHERGHLVKSENVDSVILEGSVQDITQQKLMELSLEEINRRYHYASLATSDAIWDWNLITGDIYWGENFQMIFGYGREHLASLQTFWIDNLHPEDRDMVVNEIQAAIDGVELYWSKEYRFRRADGTYAYVADRGFLIRDENGKAFRMTGAMADITERKKAEAELLQFKKIIENAQIGVRVSDKSGSTIYLNPAFKTMLGFDVESLKARGGLKGVYVDPVLAEEVFSTLSSGENWSGEVSLFTAAGDTVSTYLSGGPVFDDAGEMIAVYGIHTNINDRKIAEQKLQEAYNERNDILESIGDVFFAVDRNWIVTYWNRKAEEILKKSKEEIIGKNLWDEFHLGEDEVFSTNFKKALEENTSQHFFVSSQSLSASFEVGVFPASNGLSVYLRDVTEREQAIEKLSLSNERFEQVTHATNDALWDLDFINNTLYLGKGFRKLWGADDYLEVRPATNWIDSIYPDDRPDIEAKLNEALADKSISFLEGEYRYIRSDDSFTYVIAKASIIRDEKGNIKRIVGAFSDTMQRKEYESSLKHLNHDLEKINKELVASNMELQQFAYIASHDLQEPLRMITGFLSQLEKKYKNVIDEKGKQYIYFAVDGATRMRQIILDLLEFSRVGRIKTTKVEKIDTRKLVKAVLLLFQKEIENTGAEIHLRHLPVIETFETPLRQLFQNLVGNALKYHKKDVPPYIVISSKDEGDYWQFSIQDNGIGIDPEYFEKIFVIFQRLHNRDEYSGTGIGLAIVKKIAESLGGRVWVQSAEGVGSTFFFTVKK